MWDKLARRERLVLSVGLIAIVAIVLLQFAIEPYVAARKKLTKTIRTQETILREMRALSAAYGEIKEGEAAMHSAIARRDPAFTLFAGVEKKAAAAGVRPYIRSMHPARKPISGGYAESSLEVALERITLRQLTAFLQAIEASEDMIRVRRLTVRKGSDNPQYLSVTTLLVTLERDQAGAQP